MSEEQNQEQNKEVAADTAPAPVEAPVAAVPDAPATQAAAKVSRRRAPSVDKVAAEHQKVLAEALTKAPLAAVKKSAAKAAKASASAKPVKVTKAAKPAPVAAEKPVKAEKPAKELKPAKPVKAEKVPKVRKPKLVRDSYAMPEAEYALIAELKKRLAALGSEFKKSELLRGGVAVLAALNDAELKAVMGRVERIKTGRPAKK